MRGGWKVLSRPSCPQSLSESSFRVDTFLWTIPGTCILERKGAPLVQRMQHRHPQASPGDWRMGPKAVLAICFPVLLPFRSPLFQTSWLLIRPQTSPGFSNQAVHPPGEPCPPPTPSVSCTSAGSIPPIFQNSLQMFYYCHSQVLSPSPSSPRFWFAWLHLHALGITLMACGEHASMLLLCPASATETLGLPAAGQHFQDIIYLLLTGENRLWFVIRADVL